MITSVTDINEYYGVVKSRVSRLKLTFGSFNAAFRPNESVSIYRFADLCQNPPLEVDCRAFMQIVTQIHTHVAVVSKSGDGACFRHRASSYVPEVHYVRTVDTEANEVLQRYRTPLKGEYVWGPWPDGTYLGFTDEGILWLTAKGWNDRCRIKMAEWLDKSEADEAISIGKLLTREQLRNWDLYTHTTAYNGQRGVVEE